MAESLRMIPTICQKIDERRGEVQMAAAVHFAYIDYTPGVQRAYKVHGPIDSVLIPGDDRVLGNIVDVVCLQGLSGHIWF